jgi:transcriptional regulator with XRE-family HTH domain
MEKALTDLARNLRYLLWRKGIPREKWVNRFSNWLNCDTQRSRALLTGTPLTPQELDRLAEDLGCAEEELQFGNPLAEVSVLQENLKYLMEATKRGQKKELADYLGIRPGSLSRWLSGKQQPNRKHLQKIQSFFGLPSHFDLAQDPLFLSLSPLSAVEQREWLHQRIDLLDVETLRQLFPALERLLG